MLAKNKKEYIIVVRLIVFILCILSFVGIMALLSD